MTGDGAYRGRVQHGLRRPPVLDLVLAGFYAAVVVAEALLDARVQLSWLHALVGGTAMVSLAWRRRYPLVVTGIVTVAVLLLTYNGSTTSMVFALLVMAFTLGSEVEGRAAWWGLAVLAAAYAVPSWLQSRGVGGPGEVGAVVTLAVAPWVVGRVLRQRAEQLGRARSYADRVELEREQMVERAAAQERLRLAQELHDIISHSISMIAIQAQAVRRRLGPDQSREAEDLAHVESAARDAMAELRRLLGVLRDEGERPALAPQPGLKELGRLVEQVRNSGLVVEFETEGEPVDLSPGLDLTAYRIVQEALTNAIRHSGARKVDVRLGYRTNELEVSVEDDGTGMDGAHDGHGLRGIRERARLYGGTLDIGSGVHGGTRLHARLPVAVTP